MTHHDHDRHVFAIERPDAKLWTYYLLRSLVLGPFFFVAILPLYFRYHTLHYRFDQEGISMGWGILFRREIHLTYSRIQDIHLVANFVERWLGLARIQIQTASGSSGAEMTLEGLLEADRVRDFLYSRMRGARDAREGAGPVGGRGADAAGALEPGHSERTAIGLAAAGASTMVSSAASANGTDESGSRTGASGSATPTAAETDDLAAVLAEVAAELRGVRLALEASRQGRDEDARGD